MEKAVDASIAAIEIYNKPDFRYREEAFSILMLNAWEILLKARILKENNNNNRSIEVWQKKQKKSDGKLTKRKYAKKNRSGNIMVVGLEKAAALVSSYKSNKIDLDCLANLDLLKEIRDSAVHLRNFDPGLAKRVQQVGSASLRNFLHAAQSWFNVDLRKYNFFLMPISFFSTDEIVESAKVYPSKVSSNLSGLIDKLAAEQSSSNYFVTMNVNFSFVRSNDPGAIDVRISNDKAALPVVLSEEKINQIWPWDYAELVKQNRKRYANFLQNQKFHEIRLNLEKEEKFCKIRYLDPIRKTSSKKYYSQAILVEFDKHYSRK